MYPSFASGEIR